ncbi:MAG: NAD(+) synthase [Pirellulaceae bacterium]
MKLVKIAAGVLNQTPLDWKGNLENIIAAMEQARRQEVSILCLPELCLTGYGCEDAFHSPGVEKTAHEMLLAAADAAHDLVVSVGLPLSYAGGLFNTAGLIVDGEIIGFVAKQHLAGDGIHYEPRWFKRWPAGIVGEVDIDGQTLPLGDLIFDAGDIRIGFEICEDAWVGSRPGARHAARGADIILNPSASHFAFGKHYVRRGFVREGSRAFNVTYIYTNLVGNESGRAIYDGDAMIASNGEMVALGPRLSFEDVSLTTATVDIDVTRMTRARTGSFEPELDGDESDVIPAKFDWPDCQVDNNNASRDGWEESSDIKHEEFTRSVALGLFDYMRKSHSRGFVVSLSGGVDSTAVATFASIMVRLGIDELGIDRFCDKAGDIFDTVPENAEQATSQLLTTVYQATRNSSATTRDAAAEVAGAISATHLFFDVDSLVEQYIKMVEQSIGRELTWETDDIALQNIQARVRSPGVWMLANIRNALLLSTSNRSESAVGYATMDGDTSGGLAPIAGIDKAYLRTWLQWIENTGPQDIGSIPAVHCVNVQEPTAELRPSASQQTDEGDLMPYEILDAIERLAIRDKLMPVEVHEHLQVQYPDIDSLQLGQWTIRFFQLWCRNQWKRERFAPSFHLDDENLDPKTWCRFPILSGGYEYEIDQLRDKLACLSSDALD